MRKIIKMFCVFIYKQPLTPYLLDICNYVCQHVISSYESSYKLCIHSLYEFL